ncbi:hypothetical protein B0H34DRAFT_789731 [Crassisporium funariophilum]|nr:hypothetical protein B0H34DRAFT_789731 [Crassisporium funariophilum]
MLFSSAVQPSTISLFSSTGSDPLSLFVLSTDKSLPSDSYIHLYHDQFSEPLAPSPASLLHLPEQGDDPSHGYELDQTVLHIQSPTIRTTYIQCPTFEVRARDSTIGIVDHAGRIGVVRLATFQKRPRLKLSHKKPGSPPLLLLPLSFPSPSSHPLTPWNTINLHLPALLPYFSSPILHSPNDHGEGDQTHDEIRRQIPNHASPPNTAAIPSGTYSHVSYVRVYANCRLRRIWFGEGGPSQKVPWEFELYSDE